MAPKSKFTKEQDQVIRDHYVQEGSAGVAEKLGIERRQVINRARKLGLQRWPRSKCGNDWLPEEDAYLELIAGTLPIKILGRKFRNHARKIKCQRAEKRTDIAIESRLLELVGSIRPDVYHYTPPQLEAAVGITDTTIKRWIHKGLLKAQRYEPGNEASTWLIHIQDFLEFLVCNPSVIQDSRNFDTYAAQWLLVQLSDYGVKPVKFSQDRTLKQV